MGTWDLWRSADLALAMSLDSWRSEIYGDISYSIAATSDGIDKTKMGIIKEGGRIGIWFQQLQPFPGLLNFLVFHSPAGTQLVLL